MVLQNVTALDDMGKKRIPGSLTHLDKLRNVSGPMLVSAFPEVVEGLNPTYQKEPQIT